LGDVYKRQVQAYAAIKGRSYVVPEDIKTLALPALAHRLVLKGALRLKSSASEEVLQGIMNKVPVPTEDQISFSRT
ncbi:MAG: magnesium chelatase, partial [Clostridia bacterium]|nr:magnesium chelatase [Clostridia bacterium]